MDWAIPDTIRLSCDAKVREASDTALIRLIAGGDQGALRALFVRHNLKIFRFVARLIRDQSLAENLVSDVFLKVWREAAEFQGRLRISTWLLRMAHNEALAALGCPQSREPVDRFADVIEDSDDPKTIFLKKDRSSILFPGLVESSEEHREIIDLVYYHGQSLDEVAQILGVARKTVAARMLNARKRMEARLAEASPN